MSKLNVKSYTFEATPCLRVEHFAMKRYSAVFLWAILGLIPSQYAQTTKKNYSPQDSIVIKNLFELSLTQGHAYARLGELCHTVGSRLSGSDAAENGIQWAVKMLNSYGFDKVDTQGVMVPRWERGAKEIVQLHSAWLNKKLASKQGKEEVLQGVLRSTYKNSPAPAFECESYFEKHANPGNYIPIPACALGGSVGGKLEAGLVVIENRSQLDSLGKIGQLNGRIVLLNRPMEEALTSTFDAYRGCVGQRVQGANWCAPYGAKAVLVRSVSNRCDLHPHTGSTHYEEGIARIPMIAIATAAADMLKYVLQNDPDLKISLELHCRILPDRQSANVLAQTNGSVYPNSIIAFGGHFDSWDQGEGAHDDGAGCMHAFEALRLLKSIGYKPRHTLRCVFWINEENGLKGALEYARIAGASHENHIAALESDRGGFTPRGFGIDSTLLMSVKIYKELLDQYGIGMLEKGGGGADIGPLKKVFPAIQFVSFIPDSQRYFDVHHSETDVFESVNKRELALGAAALAVMIYIMDQSMD